MTLKVFPYPFFFQTFQTSFRCIFHFNGDVETNGWLMMEDKSDVCIDCDPIFVSNMIIMWIFYSLKKQKR